MKRKRAQRPLYDPHTADLIWAGERSSRCLIFGIATIFCGVCVGLFHDEWPFLAYWIGACSPADFAYECSSRGFYGVVAGVGTVVLMGGLVVVFSHLLHLPLQPTLTCRRCETSGWVLDIEPHGGRCPSCGGDRFDYRIYFSAEDIFDDEDDVAGADLVRRFRETRTSLTRRYY